MITGKLQQQQQQPTDDENNEYADDGGVVVNEDFYSALSRLVPSLSAAEQKRYDRLQEMFSQRRHGNQYAQQQQPVTDPLVT